MIWRKINPLAVLNAWNFSCLMIQDGHIKSFRNGGIQKRSIQQKFVDTFQGKLAEFVFYGLCKEQSIITPLPDCSVLGKGEYDDGDFCINNKNISIKSVRPNAKYLLLEEQSYNDDGLENIFHPPKKNDFFCLIKLGYMFNNKMESIDHFIKHKNINPQLILNEEEQKLFKANFCGYITFDDFLYLIKNKSIMEKGYMIGPSCPLDASNYYCKINKLRSPDTLWRILND